MQDTETVENAAVETVETQVAPENNTESTATDTAKDDFIPKSRFTQVYAKAKANEREAAELRERVRVLEANGRQPAQAEEEAPDPKNYEGREAQYYAHVASYSARQEFKKLNASQAQQLTQQKQDQREQAASNNFHQKIAAEIAKDPNLEFELGELATVAFHPHTSLLIEESEHAGLLAKHLAKNIAEARSLQALSLQDPLKAAVVIGQLEMKLQGTNQPSKVITKSKAPAPITPLKGGGGSQKEYNPGDGPDAFIKAFMRAPD